MRLQRRRRLDRRRVTRELRGEGLDEHRGGLGESWHVNVGVGGEPERGRPLCLDVRERRVPHQLHRRARHLARPLRRPPQRRLAPLRRESGRHRGIDAHVREGRARIAEDLDVVGGWEPRERAPQRLVLRRARRAHPREPLRLPLEDAQRLERGDGRIGGERRREAVAGARESLVGDDGCGARAETAHRAQRVLERTHEHVDHSWLDPLRLGGAAPRRSERSEAERVVDHEVEAVLLAEGEEGGEVGEVARVGVQTLHQHEPTRPLRRAHARVELVLRGELLLECVEIIVRERAERAAGEADADGGGEVDATVHEEQVALAHKRRHHRRDGGDAERVDDRLLGAEEGSERGLELEVDVEGAVEAAWAAGAAAVLEERRLRRRPRRRVHREPHEVRPAELERRRRQRGGGARLGERLGGRGGVPVGWWDERFGDPGGGGQRLHRRVQQLLLPRLRRLVEAPPLAPRRVGGRPVVAHANLLCGGLDLRECVLHHLGGVGGGDAETRAREQQRRRRIPHDHRGEIALEARARKRRNLLRVVEHDGYHGRVEVAEDAAADLLEALAEGVRVLAQLTDLAHAQIARAPVGAHDDAEGAERLRDRRHRHGRRVERGRRVAAEGVDEVARAGDVAADRTERLGERAHHHVHLGGGHTQVVGGAAAARADRSDRMRLVEVEVGAVALLELDDGAEGAELALHRVDPLHHDDDLPPRRAVRLPRFGRAPEDRLEVLHVVVDERLDARAGAADALDDGGVVEGIAHDQHALAVPARVHQHRDQRRVGREAHADDERRGLVEKLGDGRFELVVDGGISALHAAAAAADAVLAQSLHHLRRHQRLHTAKTKVVVRAEVETLLSLAGAHERRRVAAPRAAADADVDGGGGLAGDRTVPTVLDPVVQPTRVEDHPPRPNVRADAPTHRRRGGRRRSGGGRGAAPGEGRKQELEHVQYHAPHDQKRVP